MAKFKIYKLKFTTPLHLGDERADYGISLQTIHSDTMYSAIISSLAKIGVEIPENADFGFTISSLFPFTTEKNNDEDVYFLPKLKSQSIPSPNLQDFAKRIKKIEWLDVEFFNKHINGENLFTDDFDENQLFGKYLSVKSIDEEFITKEVNPRVKVPRDYSVEKDAEPFYMERIYFKENSGLYFIADGDTSKIDIALEVLKDQGIGTDRTIGNGFFEFETNEIEIKIPKAEFLTNLSMFIPENKEQLEALLNSDEIAYDFQKRGGWITDAGLNTYRKNSIYMFNEACVFKSEKEADIVTIKGKTVDLKPEIEHINISHPIYRVGKSIFIPIKL